jgi:hypothetical protein
MERTEAITLATACEWNPTSNREANTRDALHGPATVLVGKNGEWRLCEACAKLPRFDTYKRRMALTEVA